MVTLIVKHLYFYIFLLHQYVYKIKIRKNDNKTMLSKRTKIFNNINLYFT